MCDEKWGVGDKKDTKAFDTVKVGETEVDLIFGEYPHSRSDGTIYARFPEGEVVGFNGHRLLHEIKFKDYNYVKCSSLSGSEVRRAGTCEIWINGYKVKEFGYRDIDTAMMRAIRLLPEIYEHYVSLWDPKDRARVVGAKIWWRDQPAKVTKLLSDACILIEPDYPDGSGFKPCGWMIDDGIGYEDGSVKEDIYCRSITWHRRV